MKRIIHLPWSFLFICLFSTTAFAQTVKDIFKAETPVTWLGIDFTQARLIADDKADATDVKNVFNSINELVLKEPKKYDIAKAFQKTDILFDLTAVKARNEKINEDKIKSLRSEDESRFNKATVEDIAKEYKMDKKGIGLLFIVEGLNKSSARGSMYITFVNMSTGKVLFTERLTGKAGGFGLRNYWARSVYEVLQSVEKSKYTGWKNSNQ